MKFRRPRARKQKRIRVMVWGSGPLGLAVLNALLTNPVLRRNFEVVLVFTDHPPYGNTMRRIWGTVLNAMPQDPAGEFHDVAEACARFCALYDIPCERPTGKLDPLQKEKLDDEVEMIMKAYEVEVVISACCDFIFRKAHLELVNGGIFNIHPTGATGTLQKPWVNLGQELYVLPRFCGKDAFNAIIEDLENRAIWGMALVLQQAVLPVDTGKVIGDICFAANLVPSENPPKLGTSERQLRHARRVVHLFNLAGGFVGPLLERYLPYAAGVSNRKPKRALDRMVLLDALGRDRSRPRKSARRTISKESTPAEPPDEPEGSERVSVSRAS